MHAKIFSATTIGVNAQTVEVEVDLSFGLINFYIVGLPDTAIKESRRRIQTALKNSGVKLPQRKITVNLAPADLKKEGTLFDLPIAIAILQAISLLSLSPEFVQNTIFLGELSLDGNVRPIKGALAMAYDAFNHLNKKRIIVPAENAKEAALISGLEVIGINNLVELIHYLRGEKEIQPTHSTWQAHMKKQHAPSEQTPSEQTSPEQTSPEQTSPEQTSSEQASSEHQKLLDFSHVKGQRQAKRALQITAAGRHNILFIGSPGAGKTMLAQCLPSIMPPLTFNEVLETSKIYSITGKLNNRHSLIYHRPFRAPHHTISEAGLIGGGSYPQPGEVSLAHHGILFLDELTEFKRYTLEILRQPLENHSVSIARANQTITFPANFLLVAALNPCPCGFFGDKKRRCTCSAKDVQRYLQKLSGPLIDRIDLQIHIPSLEYESIKSETKEDCSAKLFDNVQRAIERQVERFGTQRYNSSMLPNEIEQFCILSATAEGAIKQAFDRLKLSMRGYHKVLKVARTIADLENSAIIELPHIQEAVMYRSLEQTLEKMRS